MTLDEAIQHCEKVAISKTKQVENGDWEKGSSTERDCIACASEHQQLAEWLKELKAYREQRSKRMNESEKERLIKKDIASIENRVRHAFNQGYEMGLKESRSEIPNTCGDAISRQAVLDAMYELCDTGETLKENPWRDNPHIDAVVEAIEELPSVTPQQRTGRWMKEGQGGRYKWMCSNCGTHHRALYDYCPSCGCKMEVEE